MKHLNITVSANTSSPERTFNACIVTSYPVSIASSFMFCRQTHSLFTFTIPRPNGPLTWEILGDPENGLQVFKEAAYEKLQQFRVNAGQTVGGVKDLQARLFESKHDLPSLKMICQLFLERMMYVTQPESTGLKKYSTDFYLALLRDDNFTVRQQMVLNTLIDQCHRFCALVATDIDTVAFAKAMLELVSRFMASDSTEPATSANTSYVSTDGVAWQAVDETFPLGKNAIKETIRGVLFSLVDKATWIHAIQLTAGAAYIEQQTEVVKPTEGQEQVKETRVSAETEEPLCTSILTISPIELGKFVTRISNSDKPNETTFIVKTREGAVLITVPENHSYSVEDCASKRTAFLLYCNRNDERIIIPQRLVIHLNNLKRDLENNAGLPAVVNFCNAFDDLLPGIACTKDGALSLSKLSCFKDFPVHSLAMVFSLLEYWENHEMPESDFTEQLLGMVTLFLDSYKPNQTKTD